MKKETFPETFLRSLFFFCKWLIQLLCFNLKTNLKNKKRCSYIIIIVRTKKGFEKQSNRWTMLCCCFEIVGDRRRQQCWFNQLYSSVTFSIYMSFYWINVTNLHCTFFRTMVIFLVVVKWRLHFERFSFASSSFVILLFCFFFFFFFCSTNGMYFCFVTIFSRSIAFSTRYVRSRSRWCLCWKSSCFKRWFVKVAT